jgi:nucleoside-diphosphate-sugar epimerase
MRVFVAGATGVIGRRLVPVLVAAGHQVTGLTRSPGKASLLREMGAEPAVCDVYDAGALRAVVSAAQPEAVVHQLTDLPPDIDPRRAEEAYARNDRVRTEGTRNLVAATLAAGAGRMVAQSVAFAYEPSGGPLKDERDPLFDAAPPPFDRSVAALHVLEDEVTKTEGLDGLVLRYGFFYGPGSSYASDGYSAAQVRRRRFPLVGKGSGIFSFIHVDDAASAAVAALARGAPGVYNVVDDDPAPAREWLPHYAQALGARRPRRVPRWIGRLAAGSFAVMLMNDLRGASNARAKAELGWQPRWSNEEMVCQSYDWYLAHKDLVLRWSGESPHRSAVKQGILRWLKRLS